MSRLWLLDILTIHTRSLSVNKYTDVVSCAQERDVHMNIPVCSISHNVDRVEAKKRVSTLDIRISLSTELVNYRSTIDL